MVYKKYMKEERLKYLTEVASLQTVLNPESVLVLLREAVIDIEELMKIIEQLRDSLSVAKIRYYDAFVGNYGHHLD